ncbi:hypothetical protein, partial [Micromonospora sp. NPDC051296]|uniref:hypothetical protein n=1 Tax=Micromonospora sp. NPDC051296 TaxID=3155046 RepID=UPI003425D7AB
RRGDVPVDVLPGDVDRPVALGGRAGGAPTGVSPDGIAVSAAVGRPDGPADRPEQPPAAAPQPDAALVGEHR